MLNPKMQKLNLSNGQRLSLMRRMRDSEPRINDSQIGKIVGISRERVRQLLGNIHDEIDLHEWKKTAVELFLHNTQDPRSIARIIGKGRNYTTRAIIESIGKDKYSMMRFEYRKASLKEELVEFFKLHPECIDSTYPFQRLDANLYNRATRIMSTPDWRQEIFGTSRRKNAIWHEQAVEMFLHKTQDVLNIATHFQKSQTSVYNAIIYVIGREKYQKLRTKAGFRKYGNGQVEHGIAK